LKRERERERERERSEKFPISILERKRL